MPPKNPSKPAPKLAPKPAPKLAPKPRAKRAPPPQVESDPSISSESESLSPSESSISEHSSLSPETPPKRGRGRPKVLETYDTAAYSKRFREHAAPYFCPVCNVSVSYFSKIRHLQTKKHLANMEA